MPINKLDGFPMQGQATGKTLQVDVGGTKLSVESFSIQGQSTYNLSWLEGSMNFSQTMGKKVQDPGKAFKDYTVSLTQFNSDSSWDDPKVKKVKLQWSSKLNDGEPAVDVTLEDCLIFYTGGVCQFKSLKGTGKFKQAAILDFDGTDDSRETMGGSITVAAQH